MKSGEPYVEPDFSYMWSLHCTLKLRTTLWSVWWLVSAVAMATDWTQFQGPNMNGTTPDAIATHWDTTNFVVWTNRSLTNGFSSFAVSRGRAFTQISRGSPRLEYCVAVDAATGANLWAVPIDTAPWSPTTTSSGGEGRAPCNQGDGPRCTPSILDDKVYALSGDNLHLVCCNLTNGSIIWSNNLAAEFGASTIDWENGASPRLDGNLIFINLNTAWSGQTLFAFNAANGIPAWRSQSAGATHSTPAVATIHGVRQVIFATVEGLVSLERDTGNLLWTYSYPFGSVSVAMGASPLVDSNVVFMTCGYSGGSAAIRLSLDQGDWTVTPMWSVSTSAYRSTWMAPVCHQGYLYGQFGDKSWTNLPLKCIELATGVVKWSVANFGMGGTILVNTNLLVLTEDGQLVLVAPNPNVVQYAGNYKVLGCPSLAAPFNTSTGWVQESYGFVLGYNYLGGHANTPWQAPRNGETWVSPQKLTDTSTNLNSAFALLTEMNVWSSGYSSVIAPHTANGAKRLGADFGTGDPEGLTAVEAGSLGGNIGFMDGSVAWRGIKSMKLRRGSQKWGNDGCTSIW